MQLQTNTHFPGHLSRSTRTFMGRGIVNYQHVRTSSQG